MRGMSQTRHEEIERKYAVEPGARSPDLSELDAVADVGPAADVDLEAVYFDTPGLDLLRQGITVRRRVGGLDEGWHLKEPAGSDTRTETRLPLGRAVRTVPRRLREMVEEVTGTQRLVPVARVTTHRSERALVGPDGTRFGHFCDDDVRAERLLQPTLAPTLARVGDRGRRGPPGPARAPGACAGRRGSATSGGVVEAGTGPGGHVPGRKGTPAARPARSPVRHPRRAARLPRRARDRPRRARRRAARGDGPPAPDRRPPTAVRAGRLRAHLRAGHGRTAARGAPVAGSVTGGCPRLRGAAPPPRHAGRRRARPARRAVSDDAASAHQP